MTEEGPPYPLFSSEPTSCFPCLNLLIISASPIFHSGWGSQKCTHTVMFIWVCGCTSLHHSLLVYSCLQFCLILFLQLGGRILVSWQKNPSTAARSIFALTVFMDPSSSSLLLWRLSSEAAQPFAEVFVLSVSDNFYQRSSLLCFLSCGLFLRLPQYFLLMFVSTPW